MKKITRVSTVPISLNTFCKGLLKWLSEDFEVVAVSSPGKDLEEIAEREGVRTIAVPMERRISLVKDVVSLFRMIWVFAKEKPYIVHSMTPKAGLISMLAACVTRVPVRIHTFTGLVFPTATGMKRKILMFMDGLVCRCATYINPEGEGVKRDLINYGITKKPLHVIANGNVRGVDMTWYSRTEEVMKQAGKLRNLNTQTFCFVGRLVGDKGINELVAAFTKLHKEYPHTRLLLVGLMETELDPLDADTLEKIKDSNCIVCSGNQPDIRPYLASSDIFVFPSYREGFPNVVLEAGALGLPSIATDINGCNEIIIPGENGELIPAKDADALYERMKDWVEHPDKVAYMASNARRLVEERFEQKMVWNALLEVYQNLEIKK